MNLDEAQKKVVAQWVKEGLKLSEIQRRLASELGIQMTYIEVRFLLDDLQLRPKDADRPKTPPPEPAGLAAADRAPRPPPPAEGPGPGRAGAAGVSVSVDQVARPGALVSGTVAFSDGAAAEWQLDQYGRLGLIPKQPNYKPSQQDLLAFQTELQNQLAKLGF